MDGPASNGQSPVGGIPLQDIPVAQLRTALDGLPFADEAVALVERAYRPGETMGSAFALLIQELFGKYGLLLVDPMNPALRAIAAPLLSQAVERMPEESDAPLLGVSIPSLALRPFEASAPAKLAAAIEHLGGRA